MYTINNTPGFVIGSRSYGEAGKIFSIFTRDFGLVSVVAQGIRLEKSKLRYHMRECSFGIFSLVRGKEMWRLISSAPASSPKLQMFLHCCAGQNSDLVCECGQRVLSFRIAALLKRLLHGEEPNIELFDCIENIIEISGEVSVERLPELESLMALRILNLLGYIGDSDTIRPFIISQSISDELLYSMSELRPKLNGIINASLQASHL